MEDYSMGSTNGSGAVDNAPQRSIEKNNKSNKKNIKLIIIILAAIFIVSLLAWFFINYKITISARNSAGAKEVCGNSIVDSYSSVRFLEGQDGDSGAKVNLIKEIKSKSGYKADSTCQAILFDYNVSKKDYNAAQENIKAVAQNAARGSYVNPNLDSATSISEMHHQLTYAENSFDGEKAYGDDGDAAVGAVDTESGDEE